jgi:2-oxoglutarate ferredoxin oxidoreductase subunit gamma
MESSVMVTGIGGQGIQLLSKTLALGATLQGRHAMLSSEVGGEMRGGPSLASVVVDDEPVQSLPILERADSVIMSHHRFSERPMERLDEGGLCLVNSSIVSERHIPGRARPVRVPATDIAKELGAAQASGFVLLGAFVALTGLVEPSHLIEAMRQLLPPYRKQHAISNEKAIERGLRAVPEKVST